MSMIFCDEWDTKENQEVPEVVKYLLFQIYEPLINKPQLRNSIADFVLSKKLRPFNSNGMVY